MAAKYEDTDSDSEYSDASEEEEIDIHEYVNFGTLEEVDWALQTDRFRLLNMKQKDTGRSPLHISAIDGNLDMSALLLKRGAMIDFKDASGCTPLMLASLYGKTDQARMLLEKGANIKLKDSNCWTALHHSVSNAHEETCTMLIKRGVDLSAEESKSGRTGT